MQDILRIINPLSLALTSLVSLHLERLHLQHFPAEMARSLGRLTSLQMSRNSFLAMPPQLSAITTLQYLSLRNCKRMELVAGGPLHTMPANALEQTKRGFALGIVHDPAGKMCEHLILLKQN